MVINGKIWNTIKKYYIPYGIWINNYKNNNSQLNLLIKLDFANEYDTKLSD